MFSCDEMSILIIDLTNINFDYTNYNEDDPKILFMSDFWLGILNLKNLKHSKNS